MTKSQAEPNSQVVRNNVGLLKKKLSRRPEPFDPNSKIFNTHNYFDADYLDQLKIETSRHMKMTGSLVSENKMKTNGHQIGNINFAVDSLSHSNSIYQSKTSNTVKKYFDKVKRKKVQRDLQGIGNQVMNYDNNNHTLM